MGSNTLVLAGIAAYLLVILVVGLLTSRRVADNSDYIVAGRRLPLWLCTFTLFATWFGGGTALGAAGAAFEDGLLGVIADPFGAALCLFLFAAFYVGVFRRMRLLTIPDYFRVRFGGTAELLSALCLMPAYLGWVGSQLVAFGFVVNALTGMDTTWAIAVGGIVVVAYTMAGGLWAVSITDFVQAVVLVAGMIYLAGALLSSPSGGQQLLAAVPESHLDLIPEPTLDGWLWYLQAWAVIGLGAIPSQDLLQRAMSARDETVARRSSILAGLLYLTVGMLPVLLGLMGGVLMPDLENPELVIPRLCLEHLPPLGVALVLGALLSAIMSSADSALLAPAGILSENVARFFRRDLSGATALRISRASVPIFGSISLIIGLYFENVYDLMVGSWSVMLVSLLVPLTGGLYCRRAGRAAALASMVAGLLCWWLLTAVQDRYPADLLAALVSGLVFAAVAAFAPRPADQRA